MSGNDSKNERLATELSLLESMYPDQVIYHSERGEVSYKDDLGSLMLRLPDDYLHAVLPEVISASAGRVDLREALKSQVSSQCTVGEEVLDAIIVIFHDVVQQTGSAESDVRSRKTEASDGGNVDRKKATIVVYLHHLLNTNKRKQCSSPAASVSGVTKPGYPGVLVYAGPFNAVHEHVNELKALNWQAFQIRMEVAEEWTFRHGGGVIEVESMGEVVKEIEECTGNGSGEETGKRWKTVFLEAMKMKG